MAAQYNTPCDRGRFREFGETVPVVVNCWSESGLRADNEKRELLDVGSGALPTLITFRARERVDSGVPDESARRGRIRIGAQKADIAPESVTITVPRVNGRRDAAYRNPAIPISGRSNKVAGAVLN